MIQQITVGAEAVIERSSGKIIKRRVSKNYRIPELVTRIRAARTRSEAKLISEARRCYCDCGAGVYSLLEEVKVEASHGVW